MAYASFYIRSAHAHKRCGNCEKSMVCGSLGRAPLSWSSDPGSTASGLTQYKAKIESTHIPCLDDRLVGFPASRTSVHFRACCSDCANMGIGSLVQLVFHIVILIESCVNLAALLFLLLQHRTALLPSSAGGLSPGSFWSLSAWQPVTCLSLGARWGLSQPQRSDGILYEASERGRDGWASTERCQDLRGSGYLQGMKNATYASDCGSNKAYKWDSLSSAPPVPMRGMLFEADPCVW